MRKEEVLEIQDFVSEVQIDGVDVIDLGLNNKCAWSGGCELITKIIKGMGDVNIGDIKLNDYRLPSLNLYLDDPSKIDVPKVRTESENTYYDFGKSGFSIGCFIELPENPSIPSTSDFLVVTKENGLVATLIKSFLDTLEIISESSRLFGEENNLWAWSSSVLPILCSDKQLYEEKFQVIKENGTILGLFIKDVSDDEIKEKINKFSKRGRIQVQNFTTANTTVLGEMDYEACTNILGL